MIDTMKKKYLKLNEKYRFHISYNGGIVENRNESLKKIKLNKPLSIILSILKKNEPIIVEDLFKYYLSSIGKYTDRNLEVLENSFKHMQKANLFSFSANPINNKNIFGSISSCIPERIAIELTNFLQFKLHPLLLRSSERKLHKY